MDDASYVAAVFERHFARSGLQGARGFTVLELGPGDSVASAILAAGAGAAQTYLVDVGAFAVDDPDFYQSVAASAETLGYTPPDLSGVSSLSDVLARCGATYLTGGLQSLRALSNASVQFIWSHAVLEHVPLDEFDATISELARVLHPSGVMSHRVDFQDHLGDSLHSLRFKKSTWESPRFHASGFYTNRLRLSDVIAACSKVGLLAEAVEVDCWEDIPVERKDLDTSFQRYGDADLVVRGADLVARQPAEVRSVPSALANV